MEGALPDRADDPAEHRPTQNLLRWMNFGGLYDCLHGELPGVQGEGQLLMDAAERIEGADKLTSVFGYWPSFHDAEIVWLRLDRRPVLEGLYGPTLEALIHTFEMTSEVGRDGSYVLRHHVLAHFRFHDVTGLELEHFNHQNVLFGLSITDIRDRQMEMIDFEVTLSSSFGLSGLFYCKRAELMEVTPCSEDAKPLVDGIER